MRRGSEGSRGGWLETSRKIALNGKKCAERPQRLRLYTTSLRTSLLSFARSLRALFAVLFLREGDREGERATRMPTLVPVGNFSALSLTHRNPSTAIHSPRHVSPASSLNTVPWLQTTTPALSTRPFLLLISHANNPATYTHVHFSSELLCPRDKRHRR